MPSIAVTPDDLRESMLTRLGADATFRTLTGYTAADPRLYYRYEPALVITPAQPAYVVYAMLNQRESRDGLMDPVFQLIVWTQEQYYTTMTDIRDRIAALFDKKTWTVGGQVVQGRIVFQADTDLPNDGMVGRMLQVRISAIDI